MPVLKRIAATRIVAKAAALDAADIPQNSLALRFAADELFVTPPLHDETIILAHDLQPCLREVVRIAEFLQQHCEWEVPNGRPAFAQGAVAGIPTKLWLEAERVLFIVPAPYAADFAERMERSEK